MTCAGAGHIPQLSRISRSASSLNLSSIFSFQLRDTAPLLSLPFPFQFMSFIPRLVLSTSRTRLSTSIAYTRLASLSSHIPCSPTHTAPLNFVAVRAMASLPKTMKGVWIEKTGGTEVLQYKTDIPVPQPKDGEVLVKNEFIGINYIDTYVHI